MADNSYQAIRRTSNDGQGFTSRLEKDFLHSPYNPSESQSRANLSHGMASLGSLAGPQQRKIFGFQIFINNDILAEIENLEKWFDSIRKLTSTERIEFNTDLHIPDLNGRNIQIYDKEMQKKFQSAKLLLNDVYQKFKKTKTETFSIIIFVPEGMVSLLIGTKGHQINKIMKESHTTIVVNQPINRMVYRTVKIQGYYSDVAQACKIIYEILEEKSSIAYSIQKQPSQLDYTKAKVKTKFIFSVSLVTYLQTRKKNLLRKVEDETNSNLRFKDDPSNRILKRDEELCILLGKLQEVQALVVILINLINDYYSGDKKNAVDYTLKMLIPSNYVTKLIGQKGYMIRDIIERSGGAQIKILSDKQAERDIRECIIAINGTRQNKIDATCLILQQIECFKNGGPILQSGKSINENLAQQFKNSIPLRKDQQNADKIPPEFIGKISVQEQPHNSLNGEITAIPNENLSSPPKITAMRSEPVPNTSVFQRSEQKSVEEGLIQESSVKEREFNIRDPRRELRKGLTTNRYLQREKERERERDKEKYRKRSYSSSSSGSEYSNSNSKSRSRSREYKRRKRSGDINEGSRHRSQSSSVEFNHDKEYVQVRMVVPRKLANDHRELKYIQSISHAEIHTTEQVLNEQAQKIEGSHDAIISIRGLIKDNSQCIKLLQKRLSRINITSERR